MPVAIWEESTWSSSATSPTTSASPSTSSHSVQTQPSRPCRPTATDGVIAGMSITDEHPIHPQLQGFLSKILSRGKASPRVLHGISIEAPSVAVSAPRRWIHSVRPRHAVTNPLKESHHEEVPRRGPAAARRHAGVRRSGSAGRVPPPPRSTSCGRRVTTSAISRVGNAPLEQCSVLSVRDLPAHRPVLPGFDDDDDVNVFTVTPKQKVAVSLNCSG